MLQLSPWYYRKLLGENEFLKTPDYYQVTLLNGQNVYESNSTLKESLRPKWLSKSNLYKDADGTGAAQTLNIAVYKGISEALERWAFYDKIDSNPKEFLFDLNPTTTGMASYPHFLKKYARENAVAEAIERWAIHQFNQKALPVTKMSAQINDLEWYQIHVPFSKMKVFILVYKDQGLNFYGFAASKSENECFFKALVELDRNRRMLEKVKNKKLEDFKSATDRTLFYFSSDEGKNCFDELILNSPKTLQNFKVKVLCDKELVGEWSRFSTIWRYLLEDSFFDTGLDHKFFMF